MKTLKVLTIINLVCALIVFGVVLLLDKKIYNLKRENNQLYQKSDSTGFYQTGATGMIKDFPISTGQRVTYYGKIYTKGNDVYIVYYPKNNNVAIGYEPLTLPENHKCYIQGASGKLYDLDSIKPNKD